MPSVIQLLVGSAILVMQVWSCQALAQIQLRLETGGVWQGRNDVRIPGDGGSRFAFDDILGDDPESFFRFAFEYTYEARHGFRLVYAPLRIMERGEFETPVNFAGSRFEAGDVEGTYQFDSHRITYRYRLFESPRWQLDAGVTALIRDAEVRLEQPELSERDTDVGVVPLLHLAGQYQLTDNFRLSFDFDGLAAPQGRALDLGLRAEAALTEQWDAFIGYRVLEGGVDNDDVYNFSRFNYGLVGVNYRY